MYYPEWREYHRKEIQAMRIKRIRKTIEQIREIAEAVKSTAIFYVRKSYERQPYCSVPMREIAIRVGEIVAAGVAFGIIIGGLNAFAILF